MTLTMSAPWTQDAACSDLRSAFFPAVDWDELLLEAKDVDEDPFEEVIERGGEADAKQICGTCTVRDECLTDIYNEPPASGQPMGSYGGLNRWERSWLMRASEDELKELQQIDEALGYEGARQLKLWFEEIGPPASDLRGKIPVELSVRYGVPAYVASRWMRRAGVPGRRRHRTSWTEAVFETLGTGEWKPREEVMKVVVAAIPEARVKQKAALMSCNELRARNRIAQDAIRERKRYDQIEERIDDDGTRWLRLLANRS